MKSKSRKRRRVRLYIYYDPVHFESEVVDAEDCRGYLWQADESGDSAVLEPSLNVNGYEMSSYDLSEDKENDIKRKLIHRVIDDTDEIIRRHESIINELRRMRQEAMVISQNLCVRVK